MKIWKAKKYWIILGLALLLLVGWLSNRNKNQEQLAFASPVRKDLTKTLEVSGLVDAKEKASLRFAAGGKVVYLGAKEGDAVKKWQTIATIDARTALKTKEKSLNDYSKERLDWDQRQDDIGDGLTVDETTRRTISQEQFDLNNSVLDVELATITISNSAMTSPFDGILVSSPTTVTNVQLTATDAFEVVNPATLVFKALVDEADISSVKQNQSALIELDSYPGEFLESAVNFIAYKSTNSSSGTVFIVELPIAATEGLEKYRLGMNGDVNITLETTQNALVIPLIATRQRDGKTYVDVRTGDKTFEEREIQPGLETEEEIEVKSGLAENEQIVIPE